MAHYLIVRIRIMVFRKQRVCFCLILAIVKLGLICSNASLKLKRNHTGTLKSWITLGSENRIESRFHIPPPTEKGSEITKNCYLLK